MKIQFKSGETKEFGTLVNADLRNANLRNTDLEGADLREANLRSANLRSANLWNADLEGADLRNADLRSANLFGANLRNTNLQGADLREANLRNADLQGADLRNADLRSANLEGANLRNANLWNADLREANLSQSKGLLSPIDWLEQNAKKSKDGFVLEKTFGYAYEPPNDWNIKEGAILNEIVNFNRTQECACGINVATREWCDENTSGERWACLIRWEWLAGVCVPYNTDGKIRCEKIELLNKLS